MECASTYLYLLRFLSSVSYNFLSTGLLHSCLNLFLDILSFFDATVNGIILLDSLSDSSLLACKNATDFWVFVLYSSTLLNSFISYSSFLVKSLGFSIYSIMSPAYKDSFTSSFPIWMPFISSSCMIAMARTSSTMLNKRGERHHLIFKVNLPLP